MLYGSMLGLLGAAVLGTLAARYFGLSSLQDLRPSPDPEGSALQRWLQPFKERIQVLCHDFPYHKALTTSVLQLHASGSTHETPAVCCIVLADSWLQVCHNF